jgi:NAD(P)-dependent dehydrogenase (short-subunit alcohol dehydrogenase family)
MSPELDALGVRVESPTNLTDPHAASKLAERLAHDEIDLLIHNAGVLMADSLEAVDADAVRAQFEVNALAPLFLTRALPRACIRARRLRSSPVGWAPWAITLPGVTTATV